MTGVFSPEATSCRCNSIPEIAAKLHIEQQTVERRAMGITKKCFRGWICHWIQSRRAQPPAKRAAKTFIIIDDGNREMIQELLHTTRDTEASSQLPRRLLPFGESATF